MKKKKLSVVGKLMKGNEYAQQSAESLVFTKPGWYRIATSQYHTDTGSGLFFISSSYYNHPPFCVSFIAATGYRSASFINVLSATGKSVLPKIRIVYPRSLNTPSYVEIYYDFNAVNKLIFALSSQYNLYLLETIVEGNIPEGYQTFEVDV